jgi:nucleoside 2-deoxyribosyltransferase
MPVSRTVRDGQRIYCAGPLFNRPEREEMAEIARTLEEADFPVFLPQRDGFLFADVYHEFVKGGYEPAEATFMIQRAIFWLDTYEVVSGCQGLVLNLNGRVPDEGAVAEGAMAWMAGKALVLYKGDTRSLVQGQDNPLVSGLGSFVRVATIPEIAYAFRQVFRSWRPVKTLALPPAVRATLETGRRLSRLLAACRSPAEMVPAITSLTRRLGRTADR